MLFFSVDSVDGMMEWGSLFGSLFSDLSAKNNMAELSHMPHGAGIFTYKTG
jgi:hypothetical protein